MEFKTLFKRNANGSINQWTIIVDAEGYWTEYGQVGGVITKSDKVYVNEKNVGRSNATNISEQAIKEAKSIYDKKIKSDNCTPDINKIDELVFQPPMLAQSYSGKFSESIKYIQPKLDGIRCNFSLFNGNIQAISRTNHPFFTVEHIKRVLQPILDEYPTLHFDGELYNHSLHDDFNKIVSLVKKEKISEEQRVEIESLVRYNIYDMWDDDNPNLTFSERNEIINNLCCNLEYIDIVNTFTIKNEEDVESYFTMFTNNKYEGAILRLDTPYEHKRSKNLLKYKKFDDAEFVILDICEGKIRGHAEYAVIQLPNGNSCKATFSMTDEECVKVLKDKDNLIGKLGTVKYFGYTNDGKLRFTIFKAVRN